MNIYDKWELTLTSIQDQIDALWNEIALGDVPYYLPLADSVLAAKDKLTDALVDVDTSRDVADGEVRL